MITFEPMLRAATPDEIAVDAIRPIKVLGYTVAAVDYDSILADADHFGAIFGDRLPNSTL